MRKGLKYTVYNGVVTLIKDIDSLVDLLLDEDFILDLYDNNLENAREQIRFLCVESGLNYDEIVEYLRAIHSRKYK